MWLPMTTSTDFLEVIFEIYVIESPYNEKLGCFYWVFMFIKNDSKNVLFSPKKADPGQILATLFNNVL